MKISLLSLFPQLYDPFLNTSLIARAREKGLISFDNVNLFDFSPESKRIDAPTFGPGSGMLIRPEIIEKAINSQEKRAGRAFKIFFSPQGKKINQYDLKKIYSQITSYEQLMLISSRYEGMDARVEEKYADEIISIGDFIVMGGDVPAMLFLEGLLRLVPGVVGKKESVESESFEGPFFDYPEYTQPVEWHGMKVPEIVRSGNHQAITQWRIEKAAEKSVKNRFDWVRSFDLTQEEKVVAKKFIPSHYIALMHNNVKLADGRIGTTSVTSLDIHDIARSARTYDIQNYFIVTRLQDQHKIVNRLLEFWNSDEGISYNPSRHEAVARVGLKEKLDDVINAIEKKEGKAPCIIATSARKHSDKQKNITYYDQDLVWKDETPVLFLFGTATGLSDELLERADYIINPLVGFSDFNHLSVRSAAGIILDRWLGINPKLRQNDI